MDLWAHYAISREKLLEEIDFEEVDYDSGDLRGPSARLIEIDGIPAWEWMKRDAMRRLRCFGPPSRASET